MKLCQYQKKYKLKKYELETRFKLSRQTVNKALKGMAIRSSTARKLMRWSNGEITHKDIIIAQESSQVSQ